QALDNVIGESVAELAFHLVNLANAIDPVRIAAGGGMTGSWERLRPGLEQALRAGVPFPPELVLAEFPFDAPLIGAIALAVEAARDRLATVTARVDGRRRPGQARTDARPGAGERGGAAPGGRGHGSRSRDCAAVLGPEPPV